MIRDDDLRYLASLVRMDIRKRERALEGFSAREGQSLEEAAEVRDKWEGDLLFRREVLSRLTLVSR